MSEPALLERPLRVAWLWNGTLLGERMLTRAEPIVLGGTSPDAIPVPDTFGLDAGLTLLEPIGAAHRLVPDRRLRGLVCLSGQRIDVGTLPAPAPLGSHDYGLVQLGTVSVFFQSVRPVVGPAPRKPFRDGILIGSFGLSMFVHVVSLLFLFLVAARELAPAAELELDSALLREFLIVQPPEPVDPALGKRSEDDRMLRERDEAQGKRAERDQGKLGHRDAKAVRTEIAGDPKQAIAQKVRGLGLLGVLNGGSGALGRALDAPSLQGLLGGLGSVQTQVGQGSGGLGLRGGGDGGGGKDGPGVVYGAGDLGTDVAGGKSKQRGTGGGSARKPREAQLELESASARVSGFLSKEQINRVVQANRAAIKYCFESALQREPHLSGALSAQWRIDRNGRVASVRVAKTTLHNAKVEGCVLRQIKNWQFPKPDGGEVDVTYPFLFRGNS